MVEDAFGGSFGESEISVAKGAYSRIFSSCTSYLPWLVEEGKRAKLCAAHIHNFFSVCNQVEGYRKSGQDAHVVAASNSYIYMVDYTARL